MAQAAFPICNVPPAGWHCTRAAGHEGPCAAERSCPFASPALWRAYLEVEKLRDDLNQHSESGIDDSLRRVLEAIESADLELAAVA